MDKLVALCMIVKNEEEVLERCLESVKDLADEIIIIDTGSTDRTKEIASRYTNQVFDFTWINDFSAAKNEALRRASATWILVLDADEYLDPQEAKQMRMFLAEQTPKPDTVYNLPIINFTGKSINTGNILESSADRVFPNHQGIEYTRPIHEQLTSTRGIQLRNQKTSFRIYHTGYLKETLLKKDKNNRNREIFSALKSKSGFGPYDHFTLANEYHSSGDIKKANYYYKRAFEKVTPGTAWYPLCILGVINTSLQLDLIKDAWDIIETKFSAFREYPEYYTVKALVYDYFALYDLAEKHFQEAIRISDSKSVSDRNFWLISPDYGSKTPYSKLMEISYRKRDMQQTIYYMTKMLMNNPADLTTLVRMIELLAQQDTASAIISFIDKLYPNAEPKNWIMHYYASLASGNMELTEYYLSIISGLSEQKLVDELRLAILRNDRVQYDVAYSKISEEQRKDDNISKHLILGTLIWKSPDYIYTDLDDHTASNHFTKCIMTLLQGEQLAPNIIKEHAANFKAILTDLFTLKQFDTYDLLMNQLNHPFIINQLANYFYSKNQLDIAINYYSLLLRDEDSLEQDTLENLAIFHLNQGLMEDGLYFLEKAIERSPGRKQLYFLYCIHCKDSSQKNKMKLRLIDKFPKYQYLPFVQQL